MPEPRPHEVIVECPRCHRPVASISDLGQLTGRVYAEDGDRGRTMRVTSRFPETRRWASRVLSADPKYGPGESSFQGRHKLVCIHRRGVPRAEQPVTAESLRRAYERARQEGRRRIGMHEIR